MENTTYNLFGVAPPRISSFCVLTLGVACFVRKRVAVSVRAREWIFKGIVFGILNVMQRIIELYVDASWFFKLACEVVE